MSDEDTVFEFPSDDGPLGEAPTLQIFFGGTLDWYMTIRPAGMSASNPVVRFSTSGGRRDDVTMTIALLAAVIGRDKDAIAGRIRALASMCEIAPIRVLSPSADLSGALDEDETGRALGFGDDVLGPQESEAFARALLDPPAPPQSLVELLSAQTQTRSEAPLAAAQAEQAKMREHAQREPRVSAEAHMRIGGMLTDIDATRNALRAAGVSPDADGVRELASERDRLQSRFDEYRREAEAARQPAPLPEGWRDQMSNLHPREMGDSKLLSAVESADGRHTAEVWSDGGVFIGNGSNFAHVPAAVLRALLSLPSPSAPADSEVDVKEAMHRLRQLRSLQSTGIGQMLIADVVRAIGLDPVVEFKNEPSALTRDESVPPRAHELKTWPEYFEAVDSGRKTFELRKNDRDFKVGDTLRLREYEPGPDRYTGRECTRVVTYVTDAIALGAVRSGFVCLGLHVPAAPTAAPGVARALECLRDMVRPFVEAEAVLRMDEGQNNAAMQLLMLIDEALAAPGRENDIQTREEADNKDNNT